MLESEFWLQLEYTALAGEIGATSPDAGRAAIIDVAGTVLSVFLAGRLGDNHTAD